MKMSRLVLCIAISAIFQHALGANYIVGGPRGSWDETTNLQAWAKSMKFAPGDNLDFRYSKSHDVVEVTKSDYEACSTNNAILSEKSGQTKVALTKAGTRYFICGVPGHCASGMKMQVTVLASTSAKASSPVVTPAMSPEEKPGQQPIFAPENSPMDAPTGPPLSLPPAQQSSTGRSTFQPLVAFAIGAFAVLAF